MDVKRSRKDQMGLMESAACSVLAILESENRSAEQGQQDAESESSSDGELKIDMDDLRLK